MIAVRRSAGVAKAFRATATALGDLPDMGEAEPPVAGALAQARRLIEGVRRCARGLRARRAALQAASARPMPSWRSRRLADASGHLARHRQRSLGSAQGQDLKKLGSQFIVYLAAST